MVHSQQNNMLSYIMLFTNECCHVITLVFLLSHFSLKFYLKIPTSMRGVSPSVKQIVAPSLSDRDKQYM
jgi:hypothetical protein